MRRPPSYKTRVLELDPKATSGKKAFPGFFQWLIYDGAGEVIGYSVPPSERASNVAWARAFRELIARRALSPSATNVDSDGER